MTRPTIWWFTVLAAPLGILIGLILVSIQIGIEIRISVIKWAQE